MDNIVGGGTENGLGSVPPANKDATVSSSEQKPSAEVNKTPQERLSALLSQFKEHEIGFPVMAVKKEGEEQEHVAQVLPFTYPDHTNPDVQKTSAVLVSPGFVGELEYAWGTNSSIKDVLDKKPQAITLGEDIDGDKLIESFEAAENNPLKLKLKSNRTDSKDRSSRQGALSDFRKAMEQSKEALEKAKTIKDKDAVSALMIQIAQETGLPV